MCYVEQFPNNTLPTDTPFIVDSFILDSFNDYFNECEIPQSDLNFSDVLSQSSFKRSLFNPMQYALREGNGNNNANTVPTEGAFSSSCWLARYPYYAKHRLDKQYAIIRERDQQCNCIGRKCKNDCRIIQEL